MNNEINFKKAYQLLKNKSDWRFSIKLFHHDNNSEPFLFTESEIEKVLLDFEDEHGLIITIITKELAFSFSDQNWYSHVDEKYVSFGSKKSEETYFIIEFC